MEAFTFTDANRRGLESMDQEMLLFVLGIMRRAAAKQGRSYSLVDMAAEAYR